MKCQFCGCIDSKVIDSRLSDDGKSIRRRRECTQCNKRFTTHETIEITPIMVIKKSGARQVFSMEKVVGGILKAIEKRPIPIHKIDHLIDSIEKQVVNNSEQEVTSAYIGDLVMEGLKKIDEVAYVRYAAIHRDFKDLNTWLAEISSVMKNKDEN